MMWQAEVVAFLRDCKDHGWEFAPAWSAALRRYPPRGPGMGQRQLTLEDDDLHRTMLKDVFAGDELPPAVAFMQTNSYRCPHTKQLFSAANIDDAMLVAV